MNYNNPSEFLYLSDNYPILDVRSPKEFAAGHIPHAINLALFSDEERAVVGTMYKQQGKIDAITQGLGFVGVKMKNFAEQALKIAHQGRLLVHCWRGGMRSEKMAWLFETVGIKCTVLKGGYKAYRQHLFDDFQQFNNLIVVQGKTGSGKTHILHELQKLGEQIIDLEHLAHHKGSAFGGLGMPPQPPTEQFQNNIYHEMRHLDKTKRIWIESESLTIGKVYLPNSLWNKMNQSKTIEIDIPKELRIKRLVEEYGNFALKDLSTSIHHLERRFGLEKTSLALDYLEEGKLSDVTSLLLDYYDHTYLHSKEKYKKNSTYSLLESKTIDNYLNATLLIEKVNVLNW
jgi:tRNA 2-selenouridine synthase